MANVDELSITVPLEPPRAHEPTWLTAGNRRLRRVQIVVLVTMGLLAILIGARLWSVAGWWRTVRIDGGSMAETLHGSHFRVECADCGFPFRCDAAEAPRDGRAVCPNCGYRDNELNDSQVRLGDRVLIDGWPLWWSSPRRGAVVGLRTPGDRSELAVKRVAAVGGERLAIINGDLYVNRRIERKNLKQLLAQAVLVHDNRYQPKKTDHLPPRWHGDSEHTGWSIRGTGFHYAASELADSKQAVDDNAETERASARFDWLTYQHWACTGSLAPRTQLSPVLDNDAYNQGHSRQLNATSDVLLRCRLRAQGNGQFAVAAVDGRQRFELVIDPAGETMTLHRMTGRERELAVRQPLAKSNPYHWHLTVALCDQQVLVADGNQVLLAYPYERSEMRETLRPLAIGSRGLKLAVSDLQVWRDVYYLEPRGTSRDWRAEGPLAAGHLAVLGDNPPISIDSRQWDAAGVPERDVLGVVVRPFWAAE